MKTCEWCGELEAVPGRNTVYWELPDGTRAIELTDTLPWYVLPAV